MATSSTDRSVNPFLHLVLKHLVIMPVLLVILSHDDIRLPLSRNTYFTPPTVLLALLPPSVLVYTMTKLWVSSRLGFFSLMPGTQRALQGTKDAHDQDC